MRWAPRKVSGSRAHHAQRARRSAGRIGKRARHHARQGAGAGAFVSARQYRKALWFQRGGRQMNSTSSAGKIEPKYIAWKDVEREKLNPLIDREMVYGQEIMVARVFIKKGGHVPLHHHHNEQLTYILEGALKFAIDGKEIVVRAGEVLCIPSNMPHEAWGVEA